MTGRGSFPALPLDNREELVMQQAWLAISARDTHMPRSVPSRHTRETQQVAVGTARRVQAELAHAIS